MSNFARKFRRQHELPKPSENEQKLRAALATAARVLTQYAKGSNWATDGERTYWVGLGNGPELAERALGFKPEDDPSWKPKEEARNGT